jgi:hypothetical protein
MDEVGQEFIETFSLINRLYTMTLMLMCQLHHSHIPSLKIASAADLHVPYLINPDRPSLDGALEEWAQICGAEIVSSDSGVEGGKQIIRLEGGKSSLNGEGTSRQLGLLSSSYG